MLGVVLEEQFGFLYNQQFHVAVGIEQ